MSRPPLRVGVLLDEMVAPQWAAAVLREIRESDYANLVLVVRNAAARERRTLRERLALRRRTFLYDLYTSRDDARHTSPTDPFHPVDLVPLLDGVAALEIIPSMTVHTDAFSDADVERIGSYQLDVALRFGFRILKGRALGIARFGVWSYHHGDNARYRGSSPGFWEVHDDASVTGTVLQVLSEALDDGRLLYRSYASTNRYSVRKNRNGYYWKAAAFVGRKLRDVHRRGAAGLESHTSGTEGWSGYGQRLYLRPTNREMVRFLARIGRRRLAAAAATRLTRDQWSIAYHFAPGADRVHDDASEVWVPSGTLYRMRALVPPADRFWADPFPLRVDGRYWVLFEELRYATGRGVIAAVELGRDGMVGEPVTVLERPYHLSYPYLFSWRGEIYMVPESAENQTVELYRATRFPYEWQPECTLLSNVRAQDASLFEYEGRWWMYVSINEAGAPPDDELHLYHADTPLGPWRAHPLNPIKSDVRSSRPAGRPFVHAGSLYRPAQDCALRYGHAMRVHRVDRLDDTGYAETEVSYIGPDWAPGLLATHTLNAHAGLTMVDAQRRRPRFW